MKLGETAHQAPDPVCGSLRGLPELLNGPVVGMTGSNTACRCSLAGVAPANRLDHHEPRRHDVEPFAAVLADLRHRAAAARAQRAGGLDHVRTAFDVGRKPDPDAAGAASAVRRPRPARPWPDRRRLPKPPSRDRRTTAGGRPRPASPTSCRTEACAARRWDAQADERARRSQCQRRSKISPPGRSKTSPLDVMRYAVLGGCPGSP